MNTKEYILSKLIDNREGFVSGEAVAAELGITRSAVWKAIRELNADGFEIIAVRNQGYRLANEAGVKGMNALLSSERISGYLDKAIPVRVYRTIDSTNRAARDLASEQTAKSELSDALIVSAAQTAGKGRMGRSFYSPEGCGLYLTLLLHPECEAAESVMLTTAAAVAAARTIDTVIGADMLTEIKWVNDIYLYGRKAAGILTEAQMSLETGRLEFAAVGIGFNIIEPDGGYPEEIKQRAGAIFKSASELPDDIYNRIAASFTNEYFHIYPKFDKSGFLDEYRRRSFIIDRNVLVLRGNESYDAAVVAINDDFSLSVRRADGSIEKLSSGEVSLKI